MIKEHNNKSLAFGIPGLILQTFGYGMQSPEVLLIGSLLLLIGFGYYAKAKGRSPLWAILGFFSLLGLLGLAVLKDMSKEPENPNQSVIENQST